MNRVESSQAMKDDFFDKMMNENSFGSKPNVQATSGLNVQKKEYDIGAIASGYGTFYNKNGLKAFPTGPSAMPNRLNQNPDSIT